MSEIRIVRNKAEYLAVIRKRKSLPIFIQDWWLDIACQQGRWDALMAWEGSTLFAIFPFFQKSKWPFSYLCMPPFTKFMGPYFLMDLSPERQQQILQLLLLHLPQMGSYDINLFYEIDDVRPFQEKGFRSAPMHSYILEDVQNLEKIWSGLSTDYRNNKIPKVRQIVKVESAYNLAGLTPLFLAPFSKKGSEISIDLSPMIELMEATVQRQQGKVFQAVSNDGHIHAAAVLVWDNQSAKLLHTGYSPEFRTSGASIYLIWKLIEFTSTELKLDVFDFLGSMIPSVARVRKSFGAKRIEYFYVSRQTRSFWIAKSLRKWFG